jgi:hypothetical protein
VGSGAALSWFQTISIVGRHRFGRPQYLGANPWAQGAVNFGRSDTANHLGYGGVAVGTGLNYLQFGGQGESVDQAAVRTAGSTAVAVGTSAVGTTTGEIVGGVIGAFVGGLIGGSSATLLDRILWTNIRMVAGDNDRDRVPANAELTRCSRR